MREVDVMGVRVEMPSNQPIVLLREVTGERYLPIWIGAVEATAIAFAQQHDRLVGGHLDPDSHDIDFAHGTHPTPGPRNVSADAGRS